jgi:SPP1 family phage portal protein
LFYINKDTELTTQLLQKIRDKFTTYTQPQLQKWKNYYDGKHVILQKNYADKTKPCNRIITNYCKIITDTYAGYIAGKPVTYTSNDDITDVQEAINYNDDNAENIQWLTNALIYGVAYELQWLDKQAQIRYSQVNPLNAFAIFDNSLDCELLYFVRWYDADSFDDNDEKILEVYSANSVKVYKCNGIGGSLTFVEEKPHYFKDVPVSVFMLNDSEENIFNQVINLNDSYNNLQSSLQDEYDAFVDSFLVFQGDFQLTKEDIAELEKGKQKRTLSMPAGVTVSWLNKNTSNVSVENMLETTKKDIFKVTACPDMADENFLAQSGTALAYKLVGFENVASGIVSRFTKAIQRRIELICNVLNLKASDAVWRDIKINFVRNLPVNMTEIITTINGLKGTVSDATLLSQIPFIDDVASELEAIQKQKKDNMAVYGFGFNMHEHNDEDEKDEI